jgi:hypothetical protein
MAEFSEALFSLAMYAIPAKRNFGDTTLATLLLLVTFGISQAQTGRHGSMGRLQARTPIPVRAVLMI